MVNFSWKPREWGGSSSPKHPIKHFPPYSHSIVWTLTKKKNSLRIHKRSFIIETNSGMTTASILFNLACTVLYVLCIITVKLPPLAKVLCLVLFCYHYANSLLYYRLCANGWILKTNSTSWICKATETCWCLFLNQPLLHLSSLCASQHCFCHARIKQKWLKLFWVNTSWNSCYFRLFNNEVVDIWYLV